MGIPAVGDVFAGKYAIEAVVGRGGMGVVLAARHLELDERVAIKLILAEEGPKGAEFVARFVREARLASKIKSEHVVRVIDVARLDTGEPYIVMELLEGQDLAELLLRHGPMPIEHAALYVLQACEAIAEAHALGIVHRDLKPANMFLTTRRDGRPCVKVLDFGISKQVGEQGAHSMTKTNTLMGSPLYMSPDQLLMARDLDARSDVWALGVILFELLTGRAPFDGEDAAQLIAQILHRPAPSLLSVRPQTPPELAALVEGALVKDRDQRIPNVAELSRLLVPFAPEMGRYSYERITGVLSRSGAMPAPTGVSTGAWSPSAAARAGTPSATAGGASLDLRATRKTSVVGPILAVIGAVVVLGIGAAVLVMHRSPAPATTAAAAPVAAPPALTAAATPKAPETAVTPPAPPIAESPAAPTPKDAVAAPSASAASPSAAPKAAAHPATHVALPRKPSGGAAADPFGGVR